MTCRYRAHPRAAHCWRLAFEKQRGVAKQQVLLAFQMQQFGLVDVIEFAIPSSPPFDQR